jgi:hypothetical protein
MTDQRQSLEALQDIKKMMERSSRFISLSGWSGIAAGVCALAGAWYATSLIEEYKLHDGADDYSLRWRFMFGSDQSLSEKLFWLAVAIFVCAFTLAFLFTYIRSKRSDIPIWGATAKRLMWNTAMPLLIGGIFVFAMVQQGYYKLVAPACLIFYGLALVNGSKYTLGEIRYLGYGQLLLGVINLWNVHNSLYFWALGFGVLHIIYGAIMWWKYDRGEVLNGFQE